MNSDTVTAIQDWLAATPTVPIGYVGAAIVALYLSYGVLRHVVKPMYRDPIHALTSVSRVATADIIFVPEPREDFRQRRVRVTMPKRLTLGQWRQIRDWYEGMDTSTPLHWPWLLMPLWSRRVDVYLPSRHNTEIERLIQSFIEAATEVTGTSYTARFPGMTRAIATLHRVA